MFGKTVGNGFALGVQRGQDEAGRGEAATRLFVGKCGSLQKIYIYPTSARKNVLCSTLHTPSAYCEEGVICAYLGTL